VVTPCEILGTRVAVKPAAWVKISVTNMYENTIHNGKRKWITYMYIYKSREDSVCLFFFSSLNAVPSEKQ